MPVTMYDAQGQAHAVDEAQAIAAYKSGQLGFAKGTIVPISDGTSVRDVDLWQEADALNPDIYQIERPEETKARVLQEQYGGVGQQVLTGVESGLSSATLGLSDVAAAGIGGDEYRHAREARAEANPYAHGTGTIVGLAAPVLLSGGTSLAARAGATIGAPARYAAEAGMLAERGVGAGAKALGIAGEGILSRAALRGVELGATGAVEGALYGAGHALSETALAPGGDYDHLASRVWAGAKEGAAAGAITGAGLGVVLGGGSAALEKVLSNPRVKGYAAELRDRAVIKTMDPSKKLAREIAGRETQVVDNLINDDIVGMSAKGIVRGKGEMLERAQEVLAQRGEQMGGLLKKLDDIGAKVETKDLFSKIDDIKAKYAGHLDPEVAKIADRIEARVSTLRQVARTPEELAELGISGATPRQLTFEELHKFRRSIDDHINWGAETKGKELQQAWRDLRHGVEDTIESQAGVAFKRAGLDEFLPQWKALKGSYSAARFAEKALADGLVRGQSNQFIGLGEKMLAAGGLAGGLMRGGPAGLAYAAAAAAGGKVWREYGPSAAAVLLNRVAKSEQRISLRLGHFFEHAEHAGEASLLGRTISGRTIKKIQGAVESARISSSEVAAKKVEHQLAGGEHETHGKSEVDHALGTKEGEGRGSAYRRKLDEVAHVDEHKIEKQIGTLASKAPRTAVAVVSRITRAAAYLKATAPTAAIDTESLQPHLEAPEPDPVALAKWSRKVATVEDPLSVLDRLNDGTLTRDHVEALKAVDPGLYDDIRQGIVEKITEAKGKITYDKRLALGVLLDLPTDKSLRPASLQASQAIYQAPPTPATPTEQPKQGERPKSFRTEMQSLEAGEFDF